MASRGSLKNTRERVNQIRDLCLQADNRDIQCEQIADGHADLKNSRCLDAFEQFLLPENQNHKQAGNRGSNRSRNIRDVNQLERK
jgi:hypothetical protein